MIASHGCNNTATSGHLGRDLHDEPVSYDRQRIEPRPSFLVDVTWTTAPEHRVNASTLNPAAPSWTQQVDKLWRFVVGPTGSVLFSEHPPLLRQYSLYIFFSLTSSTIRKAAALHTYLLLCLFFSLFRWAVHDHMIASRSHKLLYSLPHSSIHIIITLLVHAHICFLFIYIYMYTYYYYYFLRVYIYMNTLPHARTHTIAICVLVYIHTLHIYYIIVLYVSERERPVDYGRSALPVSEWM